LTEQIKTNQTLPQRLTRRVERISEKVMEALFTMHFLTRSKRIEGIMPEGGSKDGDAFESEKARTSCQTELQVRKGTSFVYMKSRMRPNA
jgi:hypothetical protein